MHNPVTNLPPTVITGIIPRYRPIRHTPRSSDFQKIRHTIKLYELKSTPCTRFFAYPKGQKGGELGRTLVAFLHSITICECLFLGDGQFFVRLKLFSFVETRGFLVFSLHTKICLKMFVLKCLLLWFCRKKDKLSKGPHCKTHRAKNQPREKTSQKALSRGGYVP